MITSIVHLFVCIACVLTHAEAADNKVKQWTRYWCQSRRDSSERFK